MSSYGDRTCTFSTSSTGTAKGRGANWKMLPHEAGNKEANESHVSYVTWEKWSNFDVPKFNGNSKAFAEQLYLRI